MIFQETWRLILDGTKTQTRRIVKPGDEAEWNDPTGHHHSYRSEAGDWTIEGVTRSRRRLYRVGQTYAVQAARGGKALFRIKIKAIWQEHLQDIHAEDCIAEGLRTTLRDQDAVADLRQQYAALWDRLHDRPGERWADNPQVWVLDIEKADN